MPNSWIEFLQKNKGSGLSIIELSKKYQKKNSKTQISTNKSKSKNLKKKSKSKNLKNKKSNEHKFCSKKLSEKIGINIGEKKYVSRQQAIAVAYSQIKKKYPNCQKYFQN